MDQDDRISLDTVVGNIGDFTDDAILITDAQPVDLPGPRIVWVNKAFTAMTGYSLDDVRGETPRILQGPDTDPAARRKIREALKAWQPVRVELKNYRKDGTPFWVDLGIQPITERTGWHRYWIAIQRETTERHDREQLLFRTTEIIDSAPIALGLLSADNRITFANEHFRQLVFAGRMPPALPLPYESWLRRALTEQDPALASGNSADWLRRHLGGLFSTPSRVEQKVRGRWHEFRRVTTRSGDQLVIGEDIEDRIRLQDQLCHMTKLDAMGQLTSGVAHDFNNLLAVILGNVELLQMDAAADEDRDLFISETINAVLRGRSLTQSLLSFARKSNLDPKNCNVGDLCRQTSGMFQRTAAASIPVVTEIPDDLPAIHVDRNLFENALLNLLINARDALRPNGTITISARVAEIETLGRANTASNQEQFVEIAVRDDGRGMSDTVLQKAIEPFYTTKGAGAGSGLGLSMVHGFVEQSGGTFVVESEAGAGTTVRMLLPADTAQHATKITEIGHSDLAEGTRVLLVEDDKGVRRILEKILASMRAEVTAVPSGDTAMSMVERWDHFDLLLTDIVMPGAVQGDALAREFRDRCPRIPIVLLSGNPELCETMNQNIADRCVILSKPIKRADLVSHITTLLRND